MSDAAPPMGSPPSSPPPVPPGPEGLWNPEWAIGYGWRTMKAHPESILVLFVGVLLSELVTIPGIVWQTVDQIHHASSPSTEALVVRWSLEVINLPIAIFFAMGMTRYALKLCRGEPNGIGDLFAGGPFLSFLGASLLAGLGVLGGMILCIVPGVILALGWCFSRQLIVDRGTHALDSLKESWKLTAGHKVQLFVLGLFSLGVVIAGLCACGIGIFVAVPILFFAHTAVYLRLSGQQPV
jgi:uncharacterized membrane protein